jgi:glycosyltransferase involved in cell wall biosynthesis
MKPRLHLLHSGPHPDAVLFPESDAVREHFEVSKSDEIDKRADLVYTQVFSKRLPAVLDQCHCPTVIHIMGPIRGARFVRSVKKSTFVVTVSHSCAGMIWRTTGKEAMVLPGGLWGTDHTIYGVQPQRFERKTDYAIEGRPCVIMGMRLTDATKRQGIPVFMRAAKKVLTKHDARLVCMSDNRRHEKEIRELKRQHHIEFDMEFYRWPEKLPKADLFVHPSGGDTWGRAIADSMCAAVPSLVFSVGGTIEVSKEPVFCRPNRPREIATALDRLLSCGEDERREFGDRLYRTAVRLTEKHRGDYAGLLLEALERRVL